MFLTSAQVKNFRSIDDSNEVKVDNRINVLVGQNESGKTAFLQALHKSLPINGTSQFDKTMDYPRKGLKSYEKQHDNNPAEVCILTYGLEPHEVQSICDDLDFPLFKEFSFTVTRKYNNSCSIKLPHVNEQLYVNHLIETLGLSSDSIAALAGVTTVQGITEVLQEHDLNSEDSRIFNELKKKFVTRENWSSALLYYIWSTHLHDNRPKFLYFDDYYLLPGKINLLELARRRDNDTLQDEDRTALSLLQMAGVDTNDFAESEGYEGIKAKLEGISNEITDKVFEYWKQNQELDVEFDIRSDPKDVAPFNNGNNLYIRIKNRRHRVTVPFNQRSKGFIWFFSFIVWFDSIKDQLDIDTDLILLLDEPGLSLHALAQSDFLSYMEDLSQDHQILYTTHSPFMVPNDKLHQVRMVEDKPKDGTKVTSNIESNDPKTVFPLQAALGYTIAQNLFIAQKNLLVEGPADLLYLRYFSTVLESIGRAYLEDDITIIPVGGLDKVATFIALLGGNDLDYVVVHDYDKQPDARLESLIREKIIQRRQILHYAMFRNPPTSKASDKFLDSDVEDMFDPDLYLRMFNVAYQKELVGKAVTAADLPPRNRKTY